MIDVSNMEDQEILAIAVAWSAMRGLRSENLERVIKYLAARALDNMIADKRTLDEIIKDVQALKDRAERESKEYKG